MAKKPSGMTIALEQGELVKMLSDEEAGQLFKALFDFAENGEIPELTGMPKMAFVAISTQISRYVERYQKACQAKSDAAKNQWQAYRDAQSNSMDIHETPCNSMDIHALTGNQTKPIQTKPKRNQFGNENEIQFGNENECGRETERGLGEGEGKPIQKNSLDEKREQARKMLEEYDSTKT